MSIPTRMQEVRISLVWFERWGDIWSAANPIAMEFLRTADAYQKKFDEVVQQTVLGPLDGKPIPESMLEATALTPPWPIRQSKHPQKFWIRYLGKNPENVDGQLALSKVAPFHIGFPVTIKPGRKTIGLIADGFIYPHGAGLILTLVLFLDRGTNPSGGVQPSTALDSALQAYNQEQFTVTRNGGEPAPQKIVELKDNLFDYLREQVLGPGAKRGERSPEPLVAAAVIRGETDFLDAPPREGGDEHQMLQGLSTMRSTGAPTEYKRALLRVRDSAPKGDLLYHTSTGRVVWFPSSFADNRPFIRSSGCYHHNLTLVHLQAEAMLRVLTTRKELLGKKATVPTMLEQLAQDAALQLSNLYKSDKQDNATYYTSSVRAYLDDQPQEKKLVNDALKSFAMPELKYEPQQ